MSVFRIPGPDEPPSFEHEVSTAMLEPTDWVDTEPGFLEDVIEHTPVRRALEGVETRELSDSELFAYFFG